MQDIIIRDFPDKPAGGYAVAHVDGCVQLRAAVPPWLPGAERPQDHRYARSSLRHAVRSFKRRWTVTVPMRVCQCAEALTQAPIPGAQVEYHGSITDQHGNYEVTSLCNCEPCTDTRRTDQAQSTMRWTLVTTNSHHGGANRIWHTRNTSLTVTALPTH